MPTPIQKYFSDLEQKGLCPDSAQQVAVEHTQRLYEELVAQEGNRKSLLQKIVGGKALPSTKGLYLWGGVGRGKTYIIDSFFECLPFKEKRRVHFNTFFKEIHDILKDLPKSPDPLKIVAAEIARSIRVLCIDEFHVDDITDAMIIAGLLQALFDNGVILVATSNIVATDLYKNGLQRDRFIPAIKLLKTHTVIAELKGELDFRKSLLEKHGLYHLVDDVLEQRLEQEFSLLAPGSINRDCTIRVNRREIQVKATSDDLAWFDFNQLCNTPRSSSDYIDLARNFHTLIINTVPVMADGSNDVAQRFIQLVDALYDHQVKLILGAETTPEQIYTGQSLTFPFQRIISRLYEMRSEKYLSSAHKS